MANDHRTEAACLLEQGASYQRRIGFEPVEADGDPIFTGFKRGAFSVYFGDAPIYHFDLEGGGKGLSSREFITSRGSTRRSMPSTASAREPISF